MKLSEYIRVPGEGKHAYEIEAVSKTTGESKKFVVDANNRSVAAARVKREGFVIGSVNMVG